MTNNKLKQFGIKETIIYVMSDVQLKLFLTHYSIVQKDKILGRMWVTGLEERPIEIPVWMKNQLY